MIKAKLSRHQSLAIVRNLTYFFHFSHKSERKILQNVLHLIFLKCKTVTSTPTANPFLSYRKKTPDGRLFYITISYLPSCATSR